jgi:tyrosine-protein phosphatase YwqE
VIASDAHDPSRRRPILSEARAAIAKEAGADIAEVLVSENPRAIVEGRSLRGL